MATSFSDVVAEHPVLVCVSIVVLAVGTVASGLILRSYQRRSRSLRRSVLVIALSSLAIAVVAAVIAARLMLLSRAELGSFIAVLGVAAGCAMLLAVVVSRPLRDDVRRLEAVVRSIESGDRSVRVNSPRGDELGHVGRAIDDLVSRLDRLEHERATNEHERQSLITNIGHDLRSPLAALQAAVEALIDGVAPDPQRYLRSMQHDVTALSALIDDLSLLSRLDAGRYEIERVPVDLVELADDAVESLTPTAAAAGIDLVLEAGAGVHVLGSPFALARVIRNLIDNAIRHAPRGSIVRVSVSAERGAVVRVVDQGPGFSPDFREQAFERFTRADPSRNRQTGGTGGLGLAIARGLIEAHGGEIWIDDTDSASVAFRVPTSA